MGGSRNVNDGDEWLSGWGDFLLAAAQVGGASESSDRGGIAERFGFGSVLK